jgi:hypothetical protein
VLLVRAINHSQPVSYSKNRSINPHRNYVNYVHNKYNSAPGQPIVPELLAYLSVTPQTVEQESIMEVRLSAWQLWTVKR